MHKGAHGSIPRRRFLVLLGGAAAGVGALPLVRWPLGRFPGVDDALAWTPSAYFPVGDALARDVLARTGVRGAGFGELYCESRSVVTVRMSDGEIQSLEQGIFAGCGIRAVDGDRTGYAYADSFERDALIAAASDAAAIASSTDSGAAVEEWRQSRAPVIVRFERPFDEVSQGERVEWLRLIDQAARAYDPAVQQVQLEHTDEMTRFLVMNSDGLWAEDTLPLSHVRINVMASRNGRRGTGLARYSHRLGAEQMKPEALADEAREAARMAVANCDAEDAPGGGMPVVLGAGGGVIFHEAVGHGLEGDSVHRGTSMFAGRVGERVASEKVSIVDTGAIPGLRGSYNIDDEGTPPSRNLLIENGILRGFLTDRITAKALGASLTGSGRRQSYRHPPMVRMSNTFLIPGTDEPGEIVKDTRRGLYARTLGGGQVDTTTGNFTFGVLEAYLIEDGRITRPVRGATLVGNGLETMQRVDRVGPDQAFWNGTCGKGQWVPVTSGAPTLRVAAMTVGGSGQA